MYETYHETMGELFKWIIDFTCISEALISGFHFQLIILFFLSQKVYPVLSMH
jgi:hypothetical protein